MTTYRHTQTSPLGIAFAVAAVGCAVAPTFVPQPTLRTVYLTMAVVAALLAGMFSRLQIAELPDRLRVRFGPLPLWGTSVRYERVRELRRARSTLLDGLGVHWFPGRGWTFNLWGFDCVELRTDAGWVRLGTDDPEGLAQHLARRTGLPLG